MISHFKKGLEEKMNILTDYWWAVLIVLFVVFCLVISVTYQFWLRILFGVIIVPEDSIGIVRKKFGFGKSSRLPDGKLVALNGESGIQADTLAPGLHTGYWTWQYTVRLEKFITIDEDSVGIVEARDGASMTGGRVLAKFVECDSFQDARAFLMNGGERGPQISIIPPGTYRINTDLFSVVTEDVLEIDDKKVGIVTTKEGKALVTGDIAGKEISDHSMFQNGQAFIDNGGFKGLQEQVLLAGRYYINPRFAAIEQVDMTVVPIAHVGVLISYVGSAGQDVTGEEFRHGNLVGTGQKGVCFEPLDPGKYAINPFTHKIEIVPTSNVLLNWANNKSESHRLDEKLNSITVRSADGFNFNLDVSQIIHIPRANAPKVIAQFGTVENLVTQVLEPTIGNYFRNSAQGSDVIAFLKSRQEKQADAATKIEAALAQYNVGAVDTLIGDINPPEELMKTLTDRKIASEQNTTYETEREAEDTRAKLEQAKAMADTQKQVVAAERTVSIKEFEAKAKVKAASGDAEAKTINAKADAEVLTVVGDAEAKKINAVGTAEAEVIRLKTEAVGQNNYALIEVGRALAENKVAMVPHIMVSGSDGENGGGLMNAFIGNLLASKENANGANGGNNRQSNGQPKPVASEGQNRTKQPGAANQRTEKKEQVDPASDQSDAK